MIFQGYSNNKNRKYKANSLYRLGKHPFFIFLLKNYTHLFCKFYPPEQNGAK